MITDPYSRSAVIKAARIRCSIIDTKTPHRHTGLDPIFSKSLKPLDSGSHRWFVRNDGLIRVSLGLPPNQVGNYKYVHC